MLHCIQPVSVNAGLLGIPLAPAGKLLRYLRIVKIQIRTHQIIIVSKLGIHFLVPVFSRKLEDGFDCSVLIPVDAIKMCPVPCKIGIFSFSSRKCKLRPRPNRLGIAYHLIPAVRIELFGRYLLHLICTNSMIQYDICIYLDFLIMQCFDRCQVFCFRTILCRDGSLLIKLTQVIQVIDTVPDIFFSLCAFICRR